MKNLTFGVLSDEELKTIDSATMEVLEEVGVCVQNAEARRILEKAGAKIGKHDEIARIPSQLIREAIYACSP